ncbi:helix-turn-helix transcriptional regulator [Actinomyces massiliensis]|uniref:DNA-binding helix-turn-helix protein n=1 Tax=Actinomyces massiliensis F0489 TaxID=1125718 RepID=J0NNS9_9ACTO|nr:helix-turn-helix transcriptional regulator [Actinomyces massiliensis]EJF46422.1 DNA-binding helix-turn-helix protein [Actinomyces massiliensis F0489]WLD72096.1 helix-turn-helix transcriptional regulator [Actinomyces massiliensis]
MDLYELLGEDKDAPEHRLARALRDADDQLFKDLVAARKNQGLTQKQMAQRMDTTQAAVSRFESGRTDPHLSTLRSYAMALGVVVRHEVVSQAARPTWECAPGQHSTWDTAGHAARLAGSRALQTKSLA